MDIKNMKVTDILKIIVLVGAVIGAIWAVEDRYCTRVAAKEMEQQTLQTFKQFQQQMNENIDRQTLDRLMAEKRTLKRELNQNPNDTDLQEEYQEVLKEIDRIKARLEEYKRLKDN